MKKSILAAILAMLTMSAITARAQNVEDTSASPVIPDSGFSVPDNGLASGQIHGFIPANWSASMITAIDLQTPDGQNWFHGLSKVQSINEQTKFVCENPGPTTLSSNTGDFYFYDMPPGSYVVAACMQTPEGQWRSGASVIQLEAGQDAAVALGPANGEVMRNNIPFYASFYVGLWSPVSFGPNHVWGWPVAGWHPTIYYKTPAARIAPVWVRPAQIAVGTRLFVPPYNDVVRGNFTYAAYRNHGFVELTARGGVVLPPAHTFQPITPEVEAKLQASPAVSVRSAEPAREPEPAPVFGDEVKVNRELKREDVRANSRKAAAAAAAPRDGSNPASVPAAHATTARPAPASQAHPAVAKKPQDQPQDKSQAKPQAKPQDTTSSAPPQHPQAHPAPHSAPHEAGPAHNQTSFVPQALHTWASRRIA